MGSAKKRRTVSKPRKGGALPPPPPGRARSSVLWKEISAIAWFLVGSFFIYSTILFGVNFTSGSIRSDYLGSLGHEVGGLFFRILGFSGVIVGFWLLFLAKGRWSSANENLESAPKRIFITGIIGLVIVSAMLGATMASEYGGGLVGLRLSQFLRSGIGLPASIFIQLLLFILFIPLAVGLPMRSSAAGVSGASNLLVRSVVNSFSLLGKGIGGVYSFLLDPFGGGERDDEEELEEDVLPTPKVRKNRVVERVEPEEEEEVEPEVEEQFSHVVVKRRDGPNKKTAPGNIRKVTDASVPQYSLPSVELLKKGEPSSGGENDEELVQLSRQIEAKLRDFSIAGKITEVHPGPVITLFEFEPAPGVKVGRIQSLQDDLAMSIRASSVRIIAPIPKKGTVGIEVPNRIRDIVRLRDILESEAFTTAESILSVPLGKDTYGDSVVVDVATMPHVLIAGATGTGKSVCINALLLSLLYKATPEELGLILIDPKILELSVYDGIPHLKVPVVTVPKQAKAVLDWAVKEMDRRYRLMQRYGVRNIDGYNEVAKGSESGKGKGSLEAKVQRIDVLTNGSREVEEEDEVKIQDKIEVLPKIVIVIDELADLMLTVGREVEELITRLAQKARAAGIHLILATQRPSVDVITGLIKANFPARLSFRVTSRIDSRTILDSMGAERLLGRGDMLFLQPGAHALRRVHGAFVSDDEVQRVVESVKAQRPPEYDERIMAICEKALTEDSGDGESSDGGGVDDYDPFYDKAVDLVTQKGQASTSMIQRAFRIGYNRAARIIEMMEKDGVIGPMDGVKPREVLVGALREG